MPAPIASISTLSLSMLSARVRRPDDDERSVWDGFVFFVFCVVLCVVFTPGLGGGDEMRYIHCL